MRAPVAIVIVSLAFSAEAKKQMQSTAELIKHAEVLLSAGDSHKGVALLREVLDRDPINVAAFGDLVTAAEAWPDAADELLGRLKKALDVSLDPEVTRKLRWWYLTCAVYFDRPAIVAELLAKPDNIILGDDQRRAAVGALIAEVGRKAEAERYLTQSQPPLARYHLARLSMGRGDPASARQLLNALKGDVAADMLRNVGLAQLDLRAAGGVAAAKRLLAERYRSEVEVSLPPLVVSEIKLLDVQVAVIEGRAKDAREVAQGFASPPYRADPSAMMRAARLIGVPLWKAQP